MKLQSQVQKEQVQRQGRKEILEEEGAGLGTLKEEKKILSVEVEKEASQIVLHEPAGLSRRSQKGGEEVGEASPSSEKELVEEALKEEAKKAEKVQKEECKIMEEEKHKIDEATILKGKKLTLIVKEGGKSLKGTKIEINPGGYIKSERHDQDGVVYFGTNEPFHVPGEAINDIALLSEDSCFGRRQFKIFYVPKEDDYYIKDLGDGSGTFVRVDDRINIQQGNKITFADVHLVLNYKNGKEAEQGQTLSVQVIEGAKARKQYEFTKELSPVLIGRAERATINIKSYGLSRVQCRLFCEEGQWFLEDGDGLKHSTNGTWIFAENPIRIHNDLVFKAGLLLFEASLLK